MGGTGGSYCSVTGGAADPEPVRLR
jgi:hypothetical protein